MGVNQYRKKPVTIEAMEWDGSVNQGSSIIEWVAASGGAARYSDAPSAIEIKTLEGTMTAIPGDWIIRGIIGEFYPCHPDVFAATYEPVNAGDQETTSGGRG